MKFMEGYFSPRNETVIDFSSFDEVFVWNEFFIADIKLTFFESLRMIRERKTIN